jgi:hypothetical protein
MQRPKPQFHIVTAEQRMHQYEHARRWMIAKIEELKLQGFVLNEQTGHWEHPNGDQAWLEG